VLRATLRTANPDKESLVDLYIDKTPEKDINELSDWTLCRDFDLFCDQSVVQFSLTDAEAEAANKLEEKPPKHREPPNKTYLDKIKPGFICPTCRQWFPETQGILSADGTFEAPSLRDAKCIATHMTIHVVTDDALHSNQ
jgi:hypothetical protein